MFSVCFRARFRVYVLYYGSVFGCFWGISLCLSLKLKKILGGRTWDVKNLFQGCKILFWPFDEGGAISISMVGFWAYLRVCGWVRDVGGRYFRGVLGDRNITML